MMVDVDTKKILAVRVTDNRTGDSSMLVPLPDETLKTATRTGQMQDSGVGPAADVKCHLYGGAAYISGNNMIACRDRGADSHINLRINAMARGKGIDDMWGMTVRKQIGGSADSHVWKISDDKKSIFGKNGKKDRIP